MPMSRRVVLAILVSLAFAGSALGCFFRASHLSKEAAWLSERGAAAADAYARSFDGAMADSQLAAFEQRRAVLERALLWQRAGMVLVLATVVGAFCSYVLYLLTRLQAQLLEAASGVEEQPV
jgi:hypothetical protein